MTHSYITVSPKPPNGLQRNLVRSLLLDFRRSPRIDFEKFRWICDPNSETGFLFSFTEVLQNYWADYEYNVIWYIVSF